MSKNFSFAEASAGAEPVRLNKASLERSRLYRHRQADGAGNCGEYRSRTDDLLRAKQAL